LQLSALIDEPELLQPLLTTGIKEIYFGTEGLIPAPDPDQLNWRALMKSTAQAGGNLIASLPSIIRAAEEDAWLKRIAAWQKLGLPGLRLNHGGQFHLAVAAGWQGALYGGPGLNLFNSHSYLLFSKLGAKRLTLSPELNLPQLAELNEGGAEKELMAQGALPLMVSEHCTLGALCGGQDVDHPCSAPCHNIGSYGLRDEKGFLFPCRSDAACRMHIFNSRQLCLLEEIPALRAAGINRLCLDLRLYERPHALRLASLYQLAVSDEWGYQEALEKLPQVAREYTKGHLHRGV